MRSTVLFVINEKFENRSTTTATIHMETVHDRGNFVMIGQAVAEIRRFNGLRNGGCPPY